MADTRAEDRKEVGKLIDSAKTTRDRERAQQTLHKISHESATTNALRENLIGAIRNNDHRARQYFERELNKHGR